MNSMQAVKCECECERKHTTAHSSIGQSVKCCMNNHCNWTLWEHKIIDLKYRYDFDDSINGIHLLRIQSTLLKSNVRSKKENLEYATFFKVVNGVTPYHNVTHCTSTNYYLINSNKTRMTEREREGETPHNLDLNWRSTATATEIKWPWTEINDGLSMKFEEQ